MNEKQGLYYLDGSYKSDKQIKLEALENGTFIWEGKDDLMELRNRSFEKWQQEALRRQKSKQELGNIPPLQRIFFNGKEPITLALIGDVHAGAENCNYELFGDTVQLVKNHPRVKSVLYGDLIDAFFWNQALQEDMLNHNEQLSYMNAALDSMKGEIVGAYKGNHERWSERTTVSPLYHKWIETFGTPYFEGKGVLEIGFPQLSYTMMGSHKLPGSSMYNKNHPQMRESRFGEQGRDIYVSGHTHEKSCHTQYANVQGTRVQQMFINVGSFKSGDGYGDDKGYDPFADDQLGAVFLTLYPDKREMKVDMSLEQVYRTLGE